LIRPEERATRWVSLTIAAGAHLGLAVAAYLYVVVPPSPASAVRITPPVNLCVTLIPPPPPPRPVRVHRRDPILLPPVPASDDRPAEPVPVDRPVTVRFEPRESIPPLDWAGRLQQPPPPPGPLEIGPGVEPPRLVPGTRVEPVYPEEARRAGLEGRVHLRAVIHRDGTVGEIRVLRAPHHDPGFSDSAIEAVRQWRYVPARQRGRPVDVCFQIVVVFTLHR
jgi:protein TonB